MRERRSDNDINAEAPNTQDTLPRVDSTAGDEGIDDPGVSESDFPAVREVVNPVRQSDE